MASVGEQMEGRYAAQFNPDTGAPAKPFRMALAALYIKERLGITDRETVQQITENPYLQFFVGLEGYQSKPPFDPSMMVYFRKRLGEEILQECNEIIVRHGCKTLKDIITLSEDMQATNDSQDLINRCDLFSSQDDREISAPNLGTLSLDASCAPADIAYPTDLGLLNEACETVHKVIEQLFSK